MQTDSSSLPILDFSIVSSPSTKPLFLSQLRHALIHVGFLYLSNHPIPASTVDSFVSYIPKLFALPQEEKDKLAMINSPHFFGYLPLGAELAAGTTGKPNFRELFDFATRYETKWKEGGEKEGIKDYWRIWGPAQVCHIYILLQAVMLMPGCYNTSGQMKLSSPGFVRSQSNISTKWANCHTPLSP